MNNQIYHLALQRFSDVPTRCLKINSPAHIHFISADFKGDLVDIINQDHVKIFIMIILNVLAVSKKLLFDAKKLCEFFNNFILIEMKRHARKPTIERVKWFLWSFKNFKQMLMSFYSNSI
jgi:hypothetical protein